MLLFRGVIKIAGAASIAFLLAGCAALPRAGPDDGVIANNGLTTVRDKTGSKASFDYAVIDITKDVLTYLPLEDRGSLYKSFGGGGGPAPTILVGVGDVIQVTVFESQAGGLFIPTDAGSRPGNFVTFPQQTVDGRGFITVPYAGSVRALRRSLPDIEADIVSRLLDKAIEPQVTVALIEQNATDATVLGDVNKPNKFAITQSGDRILDMISRAGGLSYKEYESFVTLKRRGKKGTVFFPNLISKRSENIYVAPGDTIYIYRQQRKYLAFGATGLTGQFDFETDELDLTQAVARAGGLIDSRADPAQVFLYRLEERQALEKMGANLSRFDPDYVKIPTIYRANFRKPDSFFLSSGFTMRDGDVIYVSNSDAVELVKFLEVLNSVTSTAAGATVDALSVKNGMKALF